MKRHLPYGVGRTREAGIEAADTGLDTIQNSFGDFIAVDIPRRELTHSAVHSEIILSCGDNEIYFLQHSIVVHPVMMEQSSAGSFARAVWLVVNYSSLKNTIRHKALKHYEFEVNCSKAHHQKERIFHPSQGAIPRSELPELWATSSILR